MGNRPPIADGSIHVLRKNESGHDGFGTCRKDDSITYIHDGTQEDHAAR